MSLATWKEEFYSVPAKFVGPAQATAHSLTKWIGLRSENLAKHDVRACVQWIRDLADVDYPILGLRIDAASCALCSHYDSGDDCDLCPLSIVRGGIRCDRPRKDENESPYSMFTAHHDPEPMIMWLTRAMEFEKLSHEEQS